MNTYFADDGIICVTFSEFSLVIFIIKNMNVSSFGGPISILILTTSGLIGSTVILGNFLKKILVTIFSLFHYALLLVICISNV